MKSINITAATCGLLVVCCSLVGCLDNNQADIQAERETWLARLAQSEHAADQLRKKNAQLEKALADATEEVSQLRREVKAALASIDATSEVTPPATNPETSLAPAPASAVSAAEQLQTRLEQLRTTYDQHLSGIVARETAATNNLQTAQAALQVARGNQPQFSEQSDRRNASGDIIGKKGVRTSDADRAKAMELYQQRVANAQAAVENARSALEQCRADRQLLERNYAAAQAKARAEQ